MRKTISDLHGIKSPIDHNYRFNMKVEFLSARFGELAVNWRSGEIVVIPCKEHEICKTGLCLWTKE